MEIEAGRLTELLTDSVGRACTVDRIGVIFSAGIDSTIIAILAGRFSVVNAYSVGVKGSVDLDYAKKFQEYSHSKNLNVRIIGVTEKDIENSLSPVISALGTTNPVKVGVGIPFYIASKNANKDDLKVMLCGQGADELFGGYKRYVEGLADGGYDKPDEMIRNDVENIHKEQLNGDMAICKTNNIDLRFPYMNEEFRNYAMKIPVEMKIKEVSDDKFSCADFIDNKKFIRKYILRKVAKEIGVPDFIINRPKKATQYGSGTEKIIERIAREKGFKEKARALGRRDYVKMYLDELKAYF